MVKQLLFRLINAVYIAHETVHMHAYIHTHVYIIIAGGVGAKLEAVRQNFSLLAILRSQLELQLPKATMLGGLGACPPGKL